MGTQQISDIDNMMKAFMAIIQDPKSSVEDKKIAAEGYQILSKQKLEIQKADQDAEFRESEMVLKESAAKLEEDKFKEELAKNEREDKLRRAENSLNKLKVYGGFGTWTIGTILYEINYRGLLHNDTQTLNVIPQRPYMMLKDLGKYAYAGTKALMGR